MKIFVKAKPGAKAAKIEKTGDFSFEIWVKEAPRKNQANIAIMEALAAYLKIAPSRIILVSGFSSKQKIFDIS